MESPRPGFTLSAGIKQRPYRGKKTGACGQRPNLSLTVNAVLERICHVPFMLYEGLILQKPSGNNFVPTLIKYSRQLIVNRK